MAKQKTIFDIVGIYAKYNIIYKILEGFVNTYRILAYITMLYIYENGISNMLVIGLPHFVKGGVIRMADSFKDYRTDYLFLLVGTNPLPNYVSALSFAKKEGTIILLHSGGNRGTAEIAKNLKWVITKRLPEVRIEPREIFENDGMRITARVDEILGNINRQATIGLNYTGGTKAMAVHVYQAIKSKCPAVFSYLDARTLSMFIDANEDAPVKSIPVSRLCHVQLKEILLLHNYRRYKINDSPVQPVFCRAVAEICSKENSYKEWRGWLEETVKDNFETLPAKSKYPLLENVINTIDTLCDGKASPDLLAQKLGRDRLKNCKDYLEGKWLDEYVFCSLQQVADDLGLKDIGFNLNIEKFRDFELDAVFMLGYQLFALSCKASDKKKQCKLGLFEAYTRARQIGGDEARVGLVCCYDRPNELRREVEESWFAKGRVEVFGISDLPCLPEKLRDWVISANNDMVEGGAR